MQVADSLVTERYAMFQLGVRGVRSSQLLSDRHRGLVALQGQFHIALSKLRLGNLFLAGRKILLPPGARGVDVDQLLSDRPGFLASCRSACERSTNLAVYWRSRSQRRPASAKSPTTSGSSSAPGPARPGLAAHSQSCRG